MTNPQNSTEDRLDQVEDRLDRVESLLASAGQVILDTSRLAQQNTEQLSRIERTMADFALHSASDRVEFEAWRRTTAAALEKIDRVLDYWMQRDGEQPEG
ncbi:hypothetical protein PN498_18235 [Oscillatoria sp. CS-180]|uniref:hypothetical protein n=1 Tax=Oscillatoria sp. CS-180 TaxID=3021720 RepID=UPI00232DD37E|nr:hypothetical protein [Oscillatoria sp. CS-180]MDB9527938.1 hypothetical protein [Oscillatoria sp. CS-180]